MLITDDAIAESLVEVIPERYKVLCARGLCEVTGGKLTSKYECCACAMPAKGYNRPCEMCGRTNFRRAIKH